MTLITLLLVLALDRLLVGHREIGVTAYIDSGLAALAERLPATWNGIAGGLALVAPAVVVTALLQWLVSGWLFGLLGFAFAVAVALLMLGPSDVLDDLEHYIDASRRGDHERRAFYYQRLLGGVEATAHPADDEADRVAYAVLYRLHDHLFAPLFWFCLLGPMGAVFYRVAAQGALQPPAALAERPALVRALADIMAVLGWLPARLLAFAYAMTGRFDSAIRRLRAGARAGTDGLTANRDLLGETGRAALDDGGEDDEPRTAQRASAARALAIRAGIFWLAILALLTLTGWLG